ncbi:MAG: hypothetical protein ACYCSO_01665 [Cuniculiplasma sp.]
MAYEGFASTGELNRGVSASVTSSFFGGIRAVLLVSLCILPVEALFSFFRGKDNQMIN